MDLRAVCLVRAIFDGVDDLLMKRWMDDDGSVRLDEGRSQVVEVGGRGIFVGKDERVGDDLAGCG